MPCQAERNASRAAGTNGCSAAELEGWRVSLANAKLDLDLHEGDLGHLAQRSALAFEVSSVLPADQHVAHQVSRLRGSNALLLLALVTLYVGDALRTLHRRSTATHVRAKLS